VLAETGRNRGATKRRTRITFLLLMEMSDLRLVGGNLYLLASGELFEMVRPDMNGFFSTAASEAS
jgi:hypothetical protein